MRGGHLPCRTALRTNASIGTYRYNVSAEFPSRESRWDKIMMILQGPNFRTTFGAKFVDVCCTDSRGWPHLLQLRGRAWKIRRITNLGYPLSLVGDAQRPVNFHNYNFGGRTVVNNFGFVVYDQQDPPSNYS